MGEYADLALDGAMCEQCGHVFDDTPPGYPRTCEGCTETPKPKRRKRKATKPRTPKS